MTNILKNNDVVSNNEVRLKKKTKQKRQVIIRENDLTKSKEFVDALKKMINTEKIEEK